MATDNHKLDFELRVLLLISRNLPPQIKGIGKVAGVLRRFYLRKPRQDAIVDVLGSKMLLTPGESVSNNACLFIPQIYDRIERNFLQKNLKQGEVFVDIGAHIGYYSFVAAKIVGDNGTVLAIEADPYTYKNKLVYNIGLNDFNNIRPINIGLSDKKETLMLAIGLKNRGGSSFVKASSEKVGVQCEPLYDILEKNNIFEKSIGGFKIDIEGFEYKVLKNFFETVSEQKNFPRFIIVENNIKVYGDKLTQLLISRGYKVKEKTKTNWIFVLE